MAKQDADALLAATGAAPRPKTLSNMNREELLALAAEKGISTEGLSTNTELREALGMKRKQS